MDFSPFIARLAERASISDLVLLLIVGVLIYLLREERLSRREDAAAMTGSIDKMASAIEKFGSIITELRITVAKGER